MQCVIDPCGRRNNVQKTPGKMFSALTDPSDIAECRANGAKPRMFARGLSNVLTVQCQVNDKVATATLPGLTEGDRYPAKCQQKQGKNSSIMQG